MFAASSGSAVGDHRGAPSGTSKKQSEKDGDGGGDEPPGDGPDTAHEVIVPKEFPIARLERGKLGNLQAECIEFGPFYCYQG